MGDPRRRRKKFDTPGHPWEKDRIMEEKKIMQEYGLKNKREIWKAETRIREIRMRARALLGYRGEDKDIRVKELLGRLYRLGLLGEEASLDDVLSLGITDWLNRRLQTLVFRKGLARSMKQARQFIVHGLISINGRKVTVPGYIVRREEEDKIGYYKGTPKILEMSPQPANVEGGDANGQ